MDTTVVSTIQSLVPARDAFTVYIGFDASNKSQELAFEICRRSIIRHASQPVEVRQLIKRTLQARGDFKRNQIDGSTEFTYTRFLVAHLNGYKGWALFVDSDFLWTNDIWKVFDYIKEDPGKAVYCVKHNIAETDSMKMNGLVQANYPKKNWSSMMVFNCEHPDCKNINPDSVATQTPAWLHRMMWTTDDQIGELPHTFNYLIGYYHDMSYTNLPIAIHATDAGFWHPTQRLPEFTDLWAAYCSLEELDQIVAEREEMRKDMQKRGLTPIP
jgi:lipopolysaccharide biosynthesis glycosyltransferase